MLLSVELPYRKIHLYQFLNILYLLYMYEELVRCTLYCIDIRDRINMVYIHIYIHTCLCTVAYKPVYELFYCSAEVYFAVIRFIKPWLYDTAFCAPCCYFHFNCFSYI